MSDPRFYLRLGPVAAGRLAAAAGLGLGEGADGARLIGDCAPLDEAGPGDLAFCEKPPRDGPIVTAAGACLVRERDAGLLPPGTVAILSASPRGDFARLAAQILRLREPGPDDPLRHPSARIEPGVRILPGAVIGADASLGEGSVIGPNAVIGPGVAIGRHCRIGAGAVVMCALLGDRVTVGANSVIGDSGFGVAPTREGPVDVTQLGRVVLQDDVTLGALCAVDRGAFGDTVVGLGSKLDNFTQVAHNARLGRGVIGAAFGGISGSVDVGDHVMMGGRVGIGDHVSIGAGAQLAAGSGVLNDVPAGEVWAGYPAQPRNSWVRETVTLRRLVEAGRKKS